MAVFETRPDESSRFENAVSITGNVTGYLNGGSPDDLDVYKLDFPTGSYRVNFLADYQKNGFGHATRETDLNTIADGINYVFEKVIFNGGTYYEPVVGLASSTSEEVDGVSVPVDAYQFFSVQSARTMIHLIDGEIGPATFTGEYYVAVSGAPVGDAGGPGTGYTEHAGRYLLAFGDPAGQRTAEWGSDWLEPTGSGSNLPDLTETVTGLGATALEPGDGITVHHTLANQGAAGVLSQKFAIYVSNDPTITTSDTFLGQLSTGSIGAKQVQNYSTKSLPIPSTLAPGTYYVGVIADYDNAVAETNESNNASSGVQITIEAPANGLFTSAKDIVNFNALTSDQKAAIGSLTDQSALYDALGGADEVTLPNVGNADQVIVPGKTLNWNYTVPFEAGAENDRVRGGNGDDIIDGGADDDTLFGGGGRDTLTGGPGAFDNLIGEAGNDLLRDDDLSTKFFGQGDDDTIEVRGTFAGTADGGSGFDRLDASGDLTGATLAQLEALWVQDKVKLKAGQLSLFSEVDGTSSSPVRPTIEIGGGGTVDLSLSAKRGFSIQGAGEPNNITGSRFSDLIEGHAGKDVLFGRGGHDLLSGGDNARLFPDLLFGEDGDDILSGGRGDDVLDGGPGSDTFAGIDPSLSAPLTENGRNTITGGDDEVSPHTDRVVYSAQKEAYVLQVGSYVSTINDEAKFQLKVLGAGTDISKNGIEEWSFPNADGSGREILTPDLLQQLAARQWQSDQVSKLADIIDVLTGATGMASQLSVLLKVVQVFIDTKDADNFREVFVETITSLYKISDIAPAVLKVLGGTKVATAIDGMLAEGEAVVRSQANQLATDIIQDPSLMNSIESLGQRIPSLFEGVATHLENELRNDFNVLEQVESEHTDFRELIENAPGVTSGTTGDDVEVFGASELTGLYDLGEGDDKLSPLQPDLAAPLAGAPSPAQTAGADAAGQGVNGGIIAYGGGGNDTVIGHLGKDMLFGDAGNDALAGANGDDRLSGGDGHDRLNGGRGADVLSGGAGNDTASYRGAAVSVVVDLAKAASNAGDAAGDTHDSVENLEGGRFNDRLFGDGAANGISGGGGSDLVVGRGGNDIVTGGRGNDVVKGGSGSDVLKGARDHDVLRGNAGNDTINAAGGNDTLLGGRDNDILRGGGGNDVLGGGSGSDRLLAGPGKDLLIGGPDADTFIYANITHIGKGVSRDVIDDFAPGPDRLHLAGIDANTLVGGNQAFAFIGAAAFSAAGQLRYDSGVLSGDVNGDGTADFALLFANSALLSVDDILL